MFRIFYRPPKPEELDKKLVFSLAAKRVPKLRQLRLLPKVLSTTEQWIMRVALAVLLLFIAGLLSRILPAHFVARPVSGGTYREALVGTPHFINPVLAASDVDRDLTRLIYASLLRYNEQGVLTGDLAQEFVVSEGGSKITFVLRDGISWHDGKPVTAEDIKFTIEAIQSPIWRSPLWRGLQGVVVETTADKTVVVKAKAVTANFPHFFTFGILPKHIWENVDPQTARLAVWNVKPIGSGPFQFSSLTKSQDGALSSYRLKRFPRYVNDPPILKEIVLRFFPDFETALQALREHTVEGVSFLPERLREKIPNAGLTVRRPQFPRFTGLFFQERKSEALGDGAVRKALALVLDRAAIAELAPDAMPVATPFLPGQIGFAKTLVPPLGNERQALDILSTAGWKRDGQGLAKNKKRLELTLTVLDDPSVLRVAEAIKTAWESLGIQVKLEAAPRVTFEREVLRPRAYEVLLFSLVTGGDPDPYPFWHSSQAEDPGLNLSSIKSRAIDAVLEKGRSTTDSRVRFRNYLEFQDLFLRDVPGIVLYTSPYVYAVSKRVKGLEVGQMNVPADRFNNVAKWFVRWRPGWQ